MEVLTDSIFANLLFRTINNISLPIINNIINLKINNIIIFKINNFIFSHQIHGFYFSYHHSWSYNLWSRTYEAVNNLLIVTTPNTATSAYKHSTAVFLPVSSASSPLQGLQLLLPSATYERLFIYLYMCVCVCLCLCVCLCFLVCMYVFIYVCMYICMYLYMYLCIYLCIYVCMYICMYVCMYVCIYVYMYVCLLFPSINILMSVYV